MTRDIEPQKKIVYTRCYRCGGLGKLFIFPSGRQIKCDVCNGEGQLESLREKDST